ncbi:MAG: hypothetical protein DDT39_00029 [Firmicutes bacterium]|nr:hypothetical protein [candidate division NPL-UPA2 bacterium]
MDASIWLKHKRAEQDALARAVDDFVKKGGNIERLEMGARSVARQTAKQMHESNVRRKMARNKAFAKTPLPTRSTPREDEEE